MIFCLAPIEKWGDNVNNESHTLNCVNACASYGKTICSGIVKRLCDVVEILDRDPNSESDREDILNGVASGYIAVNAAGPYMRINPLIAHTHMSMRYNNGAFDWPREDFINYCDTLIGGTVSNIPQFIESNLMALYQAISRYYGGTEADEASLNALDDAYLAMMVAKRYFMIEDAELADAEAEIFEQTA